jgi:hypothetical protein
MGPEVDHEVVDTVVLLHWGEGGHLVEEAGEVVEEDVVSRFAVAGDRLGVTGVEPAAEDAYGELAGQEANGARDGLDDGLVVVHHADAAQVGEL